jgi:hypothetical protein
MIQQEPYKKKFLKRKKGKFCSEECSLRHRFEPYATKPNISVDIKLYYQEPLFTILKPNGAPKSVIIEHEDGTFDNTIKKYGYTYRRDLLHRLLKRHCVRSQLVDLERKDIEIKINQ